jgi:hypothetical protein
MAKGTFDNNNTETFGWSLKLHLKDFLTVRNLATIGLFCLAALNVDAQFKNTKIDETTGATQVGEPNIVINPDDAKNIVIASAGGNIAYSIDGGQTWAKTRLTSSLGIYGGPALVCDDKGTFYCFNMSDPTGEGWKNEKSLDLIVCHISKDGGKTWEEGAPVGLNAPKDQTKPSATVDTKGNVYVTWIQFDKYNGDGANCQSTVMGSSSSSGKKWSKPVVLSQNPGGCTDDSNATSTAAPAVSADGKAYVAWVLQNKIYLDRSFDGGGMWLINDIPIGDKAGGWSLKIPPYQRCSEIPSLLVDRSKGTYKGVLYLAWADQRDGENNTNVWFSRSYTYGDQWATPVKMGNDSSATHQYMGRMTLDQVTGYIYILYYSRSEHENNQTDVYLSYSSDSGANFKTVKISEAPFIAEDNGGFGNYTNISAHDGTIIPVWIRTDEGKSSVWTSVIKQNEIIAPVTAEKGKKKK